MTEHDDLEKTQRALMRLAATPDPNPLRRASARRAFLEQADRLRAGSAAGRPARSLTPRRWLRLAAGLLAAAVLALTGVTGTALAADGARPGDPLYPLDREMERVRLMLTSDSQQRAALLLSMADERLQEAESLASQGDQQHMDIALENYGQAVSSAVQTVDHEKGGTRQALITQLDEALSAHEQRLQTIRQHVPEPAQPGLDSAIEAARRGHRDQPTPQPTSEPTSTANQPGNGQDHPEKTPGPPDDHQQNPTRDHDDGSSHGHGGGDGYHNGGNHHH
jgi:hypothetical protein